MFPVPCQTVVGTQLAKLLLPFFLSFFGRSSGRLAAGTPGYEGQPPGAKSVDHALPKMRTWLRLFLKAVNVQHVTGRRHCSGGG